MKISINLPVTYVKSSDGMSKGEERITEVKR